MRRRLAGEAGVSVAVAVAVLSILTLLGGVAVTQAVSALRGTDRDANLKRALQAADAGLEAAVYQLNRLDAGANVNVSQLNPEQITLQGCIAGIGGDGSFDIGALAPTTPTDPDGRRWCPSVGQDLDNGARYDYRVSEVARIASGCTAAGTLDLDREIVATGTAGGVTRRIHAKLRSAVALLSSAAVQSGSATASLTMSGTSKILGDVASNGSITVPSGLPVIGGKAIVGPPAGQVLGVVPSGGSAVACQKFVLPEVDQGDVRTTNNNGSWAVACLDQALNFVTVACKLPLLPATGGVNWNPATRELHVWGNARLLLTGTDYSFCRLKLEGQAIVQVPASSAVTRVFMDDPANCKDASGNIIADAGNVTVDGQARFVNCHDQTKPETFQLYAVGSASRATTMTLQGAGTLSGVAMSTVCGLNIPLAGVPMTVYAPNSVVNIGGSYALAGQVAGNTVNLSGAATVQSVTALSNLAKLGANPIVPLYQAEDYVECTSKPFTAVPAADPSQGC